MTGLTIKKLTTIKELKLVHELEKLIWHTPPIPVHQTFVVIQNGGLMLGAFDKEQLIGFNYSFIGGTVEDNYLYSHMTGLHPSYRRKGVGFQLKKQQQAEARLMGFKKIIWTFDPLESPNGFLNLTKLKGVATSYYDNYYGNLNDGLNEGVQTDRFQVTWWLEHPDISELSGVKKMDDVPVIGEIGDEAISGLPILKSVQFPENWEMASLIRVPIPAQFQIMKEINIELAKDWREKTRTIFHRLFNADYNGIHLAKTPDERINHYIFTGAAQLKKEGV